VEIPSNSHPLVRLAWQIGLRVVDHDCLGLAAEGAFRFLLSFGPALIFTVAMTSLVGLDDESIEFVTGALNPILPEGSSLFVEASVRAALENPATGLLTTSLLVTVWTASGVLGSFTKGLNRAYNVVYTQYTFWRSIIVSILLVPAIAVPITTAAVMVVFGGTLARYAAQYGGFPFLESFLGFFFRWATTILLVVIVLAIIYRWSPVHPGRFFGVLPGAALATGLWIAVSLAFRFFTASSLARYQIYGSLTAVVVFLFWVYLSAFVFLVGAEFNAQLLENRGEAPVMSSDVALSVDG
jgi:membrane protein